MAGKYANYILFNRAWADIFDDLNDAQLGAVVRSLYRIANGEESEVTDPALKIIIKICGAEIIQNSIQYESKCKQMHANATKSKQKQADVLKEEKKERRKEGRIERRTEGLLSNPDGLEREPTGASPAGDDRQADIEEVDCAWNRAMRYNTFADD